MNDLKNGRLAYAELSCERWLTDAASSIKSAYLDDIISSQLRAVMMLATCPVGGSRQNKSAFSVAVCSIVGACAQEQMGRTDTRPVVALVANKKVVWYRPEVEFPRQAMGNEIPARASNAPIPASGYHLIVPAFAALSHIAPKALFAAGCDGFHRRSVSQVRGNTKLNPKTIMA